MSAATHLHDQIRPRQTDVPDLPAHGTLLLPTRAIPRRHVGQWQLIRNILVALHLAAAAICLNKEKLLIQLRAHQRRIAFELMNSLFACC
jgi:hypothetical protein